MSREFDVVVERDSEGYYVATVPALEGCYTQAKLLDELLFEIRFGLEILADGRRRRFLEQAFVKALEEDLENRIALFDLAAAQAAGRMAAERRKAGRPVEIRDLQIAGIARVYAAAVATRSIRDFEGLGLILVDPWLEQG